MSKKAAVVAVQGVEAEGLKEEEEEAVKEEEGEAGTVVGAVVFRAVTIKALGVAINDNKPVHLLGRMATNNKTNGITKPMKFQPAVITRVTARIKVITRTKARATAVTKVQAIKEATTSLTKVKVKVIRTRAIRTKVNRIRAIKTTGTRTGAVTRTNTMTELREVAEVTTAGADVERSNTLIQIYSKGQIHDRAASIFCFVLAVA